MGRVKPNRGARAPQDFGLLRRRGEPGVCGICGQIGPLSRTHVPAKCAGNDQGVQRRYLQRGASGGLALSPKRFRGGLYVYGLCGKCNSVAGRWDPAYKELSVGLRSCWSSGMLDLPGNRIDLPSVSIRPSSIARSILMGFFGVNHSLRDRFPDLAFGLLAGSEPLCLPSKLRLRVALAQGTSGRLTGAIHTRQVIGPTSTGGQLSLLSSAAVYFPPLAWQLASPDSILLDEQGWADASLWLEVPLAGRCDVRDLFRDLPLVREPSQDPEISDRLFHLLADELTPIVECHDLRHPAIL